MKELLAMIFDFGSLTDNSKVLRGESMEENLGAELHLGTPSLD